MAAKPLSASDARYRLRFHSGHALAKRKAVIPANAGIRTSSLQTDRSFSVKASAVHPLILTRGLVTDPRVRRFVG